MATLMRTASGIMAVCAAGLLALGPFETAAQEPRCVLVDGGTPGFYNDALGTVLDRTNPVGKTFLFPGANVADGDPTLTKAPEPNLTAARRILGDWLEAPDQLGAPWTFGEIPRSWSVNTETAVVYKIDAGAKGLDDVRVRLGADNGIFVWHNGEFQLGGLAPGGAPLGEYALELGRLAPGPHYFQILREDHGAVSGYSIEVSALQNLAQCPKPNTLDFSVAHVELNQVVQDSGNSAPLVIGRPTLVRGFVRAAGPEGRAARVPGAVQAELRLVDMAGNAIGRPRQPVRIGLQDPKASADLYLPRVLADADDPYQAFAFLLSATDMSEEIWSRVKSVEVEVNPGARVPERDVTNNVRRAPVAVVKRCDFPRSYVAIDYRPICGPEPGLSCFGVCSGTTCPDVESSRYPTTRSNLPDLRGGDRQQIDVLYRKLMPIPSVRSALTPVREVLQYKDYALSYKPTLSIAGPLSCPRRVRATTPGDDRLLASLEAHRTQLGITGHLTGILPENTFWYTTRGQQDENGVPVAVFILERAGLARVYAHELTHFVRGGDVHNENERCSPGLGWATTTNDVGFDWIEGKLVPRGRQAYMNQAEGTMPTEAYWITIDEYLALVRSDRFTCAP